jgi:aryl-alcohol dehydrogenase-like predicted oxidoreductase
MKDLISKICFGGAALSGSGGGYGFGEINNPEALLSYAIERGIKYIDTAPIYGFGESEKVIGKSIKGKRDKIKIINKSGVSWHSTKRVNMSNDPALSIEMLNQSLKRMDTDYIDIYMIHWPDKNIDIRYPLEALVKEKEKGKILKLGLCNTNSLDLEKAQEVAEITVLQSEVNLFNNGFSQLSNIKNNCMTMGWGTFDKGILAGSVKEDTGFTKDDARSWALWWKKSNWKDKVKFCEKQVENYKIDLKKMALKYSCDNCDMTLIGMKSQVHVDDICNFNIHENYFDYEDLINEFQTFG